MAEEPKESKEVNDPNEVVLGEVVDDADYQINKGRLSSYTRPLNRRDKDGNRIPTNKEAAMLMVLCDPKYHGRPLQEKCDAANVCRKHWHKIMKDPWFRSQVKESLTTMLSTYAGDIMHASIKTAVTEGRQGFGDRKMLLEMLQLYTAQQEVKHVGHNGGPIEETVTHVFDRAKFERLYIARTRTGGSLPGPGIAPVDGTRESVDTGPTD